MLVQLPVFGAAATEWLHRIMAIATRLIQSTRSPSGIGHEVYAARPVLETAGSHFMDGCWKSMVLLRGSFINERRNGMKTLVAAIFAAGMSLTTLSSAQAITVTAAPLAEAAKEISSVVDAQRNQAGGCERGYMMTSTGCREIIWNYRKKSAGSAQKNRPRRARCRAS